MRTSSSIIAIILVASLSGCAAHKTEIGLGFLGGAAVGAGLGYGVVHHGKDRQYEVRNTIITSAVFALGTAAILALHYNAMENQRVEIMSKITRSWVEKGENQDMVINFGNGQAPSDVFLGKVGKYSLELDGQTRWVYPTFRKRFTQPQVSNDQLASGQYIWEIVKPGFFVSRETQPWYFQNEQVSGEPVLNVESDLVPSKTSEKKKK